MRRNLENTYDLCNEIKRMLRVNVFSYFIPMVISLKQKFNLSEKY